MTAEQELIAVIRRLEASDTTYFECEGPDISIRLHFARRPLQPVARTGGVVAATGEPAARMGVLKSPGMGCLLLSHPLSALAALREGDRVAAGQLVALLRVDELLTPVLADRDATVRRVVAQEGALTGFGDVLFEVGDS